MADPAQTLLPPPPRLSIPDRRSYPSSIPPDFGEPTSVDRVNLVDLQHIANEQGALVVAEVGKHMPFVAERMYAIVDVPAGAERGGHAHRDLEQLLVVLNGSLELYVDDGVNQEVIILDDPTKAVYIRPMVWRELTHFAPNTVCMVLASHLYNESDYIRDYETFASELMGRGLGDERISEKLIHLSDLRERREAK